MILVVNAGSSSLKVELFAPDLSSVQSASVSEIGGEAWIKLGTDARPIDAQDHAEALSAILDGIESQGHALPELTAAGHRVVHGGTALTRPTELTPQVLDQITACVPLAPLHNPHNLSAIHSLAARLPNLRQFACFDTSFHASNPEVASTYALPKEEREKGLRRYGFHGLSYSALVESFGDDLPPRLLAFHLGNGASLCAILNGQSVATSMGFSPLDGLTMGSRSGAIDGMAVLRIAQDHGLDGADHLLNKQSGLVGLAGTNDMASLLPRTDEAAQFAVEHFCYWAARHAGSAIVAMGGLDAVAFTGGIGENAGPIRDRIMQHLSFLGPVPVHVIPAEEERQIARETQRLMTASGQATATL